MRLIDADKLMTELMDSDLDHLQRDDWREVIQIVQDAPTVPRWVPVTDRLSEVDESVLVTTEWNDISIGWRIGVDEWFIHDGSTNATTDDLIAWMPLPAPYQGGE